MKLLWVCNIILPQLTDAFPGNSCYGGSWIESLADQLIETNDIELCVAFPIEAINEIVSGEANHIKYYAFPAKYSKPAKYNHKIEPILVKILNEFNPEIIHIFGTEYPHALAMIRVSQRMELINRVVINIQGLCSIIKNHYYQGLPVWVRYVFTVRDLMLNNNIYQQCKKFRKRGNIEIDALRGAYNVIGRTDWDYACTKQINPGVKYYYCNELLRKEFYKHHWDLDKCEKYSIFMSQGAYPVKGLHFMLEALPEIIKKFPQVHLYVGGPNIVKKSKFRLSTYGWYFKKINL